MATENKITISTIPIAKLTVLMNNFIFTTVNHLNKLSVKGEEKLAEFDKKLNDLEIMTTLLESKLNSLPDKIKQTYPQLQQCSLDDINPVINSNAIVTNTSSGTNVQPSGVNSSVPPPPPPPPPPLLNGSSGTPANTDQSAQGSSEPLVEEKKEEIQNVEEEKKELTPQEELDEFLAANEDYVNLYKMLKLGIPRAAVEQKARLNGFDMDILQTLIEKAHAVNPNI